MQQEPGNKALLAEVKTAEHQINEHAKKEKKQLVETKEKVEAAIKHQDVISVEIEKRGIVMGGPLFDTQRQYEGQVKLDEEGCLHWPVMFLYEEHQQSEFVVDFAENHTFLDHLSYMFPPEYIAPWDSEQKYTVSNMEIYVEAGCTQPLNPALRERKIKRRWIRIKHTTALKTVLHHKDVVVPQFPVFYIVANPSKFRDEFLSRSFDD